MVQRAMEGIVCIKIHLPLPQYAGHLAHVLLSSTFEGSFSLALTLMFGGSLFDDCGVRLVEGRDAWRPPDRRQPRSAYSTIPCADLNPKGTPALKEFTVSAVDF